MNIAGMVLGIIAVILVWIPFVGLISIPMVLVGLPLSFFGFRGSRRRGAGVGIAIAGLTTNLIALAVIILWILFVGSLLTTSVESTT
jgi:hypothetical protein